MEDQTVKQFVLELLQAAGASVQQLPDENENAYRCTIPAALTAFFPRQTSLYFTFDPDVYDVRQEAGIEYVAPGYPLLDGLLRFARARLLVTQSTAQGHFLKTLGLASQSLALTSQSHQAYKPYVCFYFKMTMRSDELAEEVFPVWADMKQRRVLYQAPAQFVQVDEPAAQTVDKQDLKAVWDLVQQELEALVRQQTARHEEAAALRLDAQLQRAPAAQHKELRDRARLQVDTELVFAEVVQAPLQIWEVDLKAKRWQKRLRLVWDAVRKRWQQPPACPVCRKSTNLLEGCDAGQHEVCPACRGKCQGCGATHCTDHPATPCTQCAGALCESCARECRHCRRPYCADCLKTCPDCGQALCTACEAVCSVCAHRACPEHFAACHLTGGLLCMQHATPCQGCGKATHPDRLHPVAVTGALYCDACVVKCAHGHADSPWIPRVEALCCAGPHAAPHVICAQHAHPCSMHGVRAVFCADHLSACSACGAEVCADHGVVSEVSGRFFCQQHVSACPSCKQVVGEGELVRVQGGLAVCPDCALSCSHCSPAAERWAIGVLTLCTFCLRESADRSTFNSLDEMKRENPAALVCRDHRGVCHCCNRAICGEHSCHCPECGHEVCPACEVFCSVCEHRACPEHFAKCHLTGAMLCPQHTTACQGCGKPTHPDRLHPVAATGALYCDACVVKCGHAHTDSPWIPRVESLRCAGSHAAPHVLCAQHARPCSLHGGRAVFCVDHLSTCAACGAEGCADHGGASSLSGRFFCQLHLFACPSCKQLVGKGELVRVQGGGEVCPDCALTCRHCPPAKDRWAIHDLALCTFCVRGSADRTTFNSLEEMKRRDPIARVCRDHGGICHSCSRTVCVDHAWHCPECGGLTCPDHRVMTSEGQHVCTKCAATCLGCGPDVRHMTAAVQRCGVCSTFVCSRHWHACECCLKPTCSRHLATCSLCGGRYCSRCAPDGKCPACHKLSFVNRAELSRLSVPVDRLPLSALPQTWGMVVAFADRPDGTVRIHVGYYEDQPGLPGLFGFLARPPRPRLDVFEGQGDIQRVRSVTPQAIPGLPPYQFFQHVRDRLRRR